MNKIIVVLFILTNSMSVFGQEDNLDINGLSVAIVPSSIINRWYGYQIKAEYGFLDYFAVQLNAAYLKGTNIGHPFEGYRVRPSLKYYFLNDFENHRPYVEIGYIHRSVNEYFLGNIKMFGGAFIQKEEVRRSKTLNAGYVLYGVKQTIVEKLWYDIGVGLGLGKIYILNDYDIEGEIIPTDDFFFKQTDGSTGFPVFLLHLAIGYNF